MAEYRSFTWDDSDLKIADDTKLVFGTNSDASIEYDENGDNYMIISGSGTGGGLVLSGSIVDIATDMAIYDDFKLYFGSDDNSSIEYDNDGDNFLVISGSTAGITLSGSTYIRKDPSATLQLDSVGDAHLILNADIGNSGEGDNPAIEFRQDGGANKSAIGMCVTGKDPVGGNFTDGLDNAFAVTTLIAGIPIQMGVRRTGTANPEAQFTIETVSGNVGIYNAAPKVALDVYYDGVTALANDTGGGHVVSFGTASGDLNAGALYYLNSDGGWASASADATGSGNSQLLGIAMGSDPADEGMLLRGYFDATSYYSGSFIKGQAVYVQSGSNAMMSGAAPTATDAYSRIVGYGTDTANVIYFNPSSVWVELT